jgi:hypothetical protein
MYMTKRDNAVNISFRRKSVHVGSLRLHERIYHVETGVVNLAIKVRLVHVYHNARYKK